MTFSSYFGDRNYNSCFSIDKVVLMVTQFRYLKERETSPVLEKVPQNSHFTIWWLYNDCI